MLMDPKEAARITGRSEAECAEWLERARLDLLEMLSADIDDEEALERFRATPIGQGFCSPTPATPPSG